MNHILQLRNEAAAAGDLDQVAICLVALGDPADAEPGMTQAEALAECERVIGEAAAQAQADAYV